MKGYMIYSEDGKEMLPARYDKFIPSNKVKQTLLFKTEIHAKERIRRDILTWTESLKYAERWQNKPYDMTKQIDFCKTQIAKLNKAIVKKIESTDTGFIIQYISGQVSKSYKTEEKAQQVITSELDNMRYWKEQLENTPISMHFFAGPGKLSNEEEQECRERELVRTNKRIIELENAKVVKL
jgi:hypothetical protein